MGLDHKAIGLRLGFPECCIDEWIGDIERNVPSGSVRGAVYFFREDGTLGFYVPCTDCMNKRPEGYDEPDSLEGYRLQVANRGNTLNPITMEKE